MQAYPSHCCRSDPRNGRTERVIVTSGRLLEEEKLLGKGSIAVPQTHAHIQTRQQLIRDSDCDTYHLA
ncbi:hypothetical protein BaRGS_00029101 [Batillaria attramentaria]|uniref:Uncharacterized protein n=1 Tax=Batillaria attramentaria TaxID=370345 RepID=A0ABD0JYI6_9CAEN